MLIVISRISLYGRSLYRSSAISTKILLNTVEPPLLDITLQCWQFNKSVSMRKPFPTKKQKTKMYITFTVLKRKYELHIVYLKNVNDIKWEKERLCLLRQCRAACGIKVFLCLSVPEGWTVNLRLILKL